MIQPSFTEFQKLAKQGNLIPVYDVFSADLLTPVSAYLRIAQGARHSFLLESVEGGEHQSLVLIGRRFHEQFSLQSVTYLPSALRQVREPQRCCKWGHRPGDGDDIVQPGILSRCRLEERCNAEIIVAGIDGLSLLDARNDIGRSVTDAAIGHADQRINLLVDGAEWSRQPVQRRRSVSQRLRKL